MSSASTSARSSIRAPASYRRLPRIWKKHSGESRRSDGGGWALCATNAICPRFGTTADCLGDYEAGRTLMPLDVQERLASFVLAHEPALGRLAHQLRLQVQASRQYEAGDVVRHLTSPP